MFWAANVISPTLAIGAIWWSCGVTSQKTNTYQTRVQAHPFQTIFRLHEQKNKLFLAQECSVFLFPLRGTMSQKTNTCPAKLWSLKAGWPTFRPLDADGSWGSTVGWGEKPALFWHGWAHAILHISRLSTGCHKTVFIHWKVAQKP